MGDSAQKDEIAEMAGNSQGMGCDVFQDEDEAQLRQERGQEQPERVRVLLTSSYSETRPSRFVENVIFEASTMLKSTYQPVEDSTLPPGWTAHKAPTGHTYYYNPQTKQSTYSRPQPQQPQQPQQIPVPKPPPPPPLAAPAVVHPSAGAFTPYVSPLPANNGIHPSRQAIIATTSSPYQSHAINNNLHNPNFQRRREPEDRPKSKHAIPGCAPWLLVQTKLGRRFVHNPTTTESFWKFPKEVEAGVIKYDIRERKRAAGEVVEEEEEEVLEQRQVREEARPRSTVVEHERNAAELSTRQDQPEQNEPPAQKEDEDVIYEEVYVTDEEDNDTAPPPKRLRGHDDEDQDDTMAEEHPANQQNNVAHEFTEEDMAYQLAQLGETYDLDPGEYDAGQMDDGYYEEGAEGLDMTEEECNASFHDLLNDHGINPYKPFDSIIEEGTIIPDDRYTLLPNMAARRKAFLSWSTAKIQHLKEEKEKMVRQDPRIPYLDLLARHATPKLFWPEFKRKFKKEPEMKEMRLPEKEKEKLYREHITRTTKMDRDVLEKDLKALLEEVEPSKQWNRESSMELLPAKILSDVRYISLRPESRDAVVEAFLKRLPGKEDVEDVEETAAEKQARDDRMKRDDALRERKRRVEEDKRRQQRDLQFGQRRLREGEEELRRAMQVGKEGLRTALG